MFPPRDGKQLAHLLLTAAEHLASLIHLCAVCAAFAVVPCVPCLPCSATFTMRRRRVCINPLRHAARRTILQNLIFQNYAQVAVPCVPLGSAPVGATCALCAVCQMCAVLSASAVFLVYAAFSSSAV